MKKIIALILVFTFALTTVCFAHPFNDVAGHWAEAEIEKGYTNKVINGDGDGTFRPDDAITRGEFIKMLVAVIWETAGAAAGEDASIPDEIGDGTHWASKYKEVANAYLFPPMQEEIDGVVGGTMDSAEDYDKAIYRWEMAYMLGASAYNLTGLDVGDAEIVFADKAEISKYPELVVATISQSNILGFMKGDENNNFAPRNSGTRAEAVTVINRMGDFIQSVIDDNFELDNEYLQDTEDTLVTYDEIPKGHPQATILMENNKKIVIELYPEYAPQTVANFVKLAKEGFYDGLTFHRVVEGFVAQGGDPEGTGMGGSGNTILGEFASNGFDKNILKHERGTVSMARSKGFNTASSQFFICYDDAEFLDGEYAAFGKVKSGMDTVDSFLKVEMEMNNSGEMASPKQPIKIKSVIIK